MARHSQRKDELELAWTIFNEFKVTRDFWAPWRDRAKESIQFWRGVQWNAADRKYLDDKRRPVLVFNQLLSQIDVVMGNQKLNRFDTVAKPRGAEDAGYSEIINALLKHFKDNQNFPFMESKVFLYCILTGVGWFDLEVDYSENPEGDVKQTWRNTLQMYPDEDAVEDDYTDEAKTFDSLWVSKQQLIKLHPDKRSLIEKQITFMDPESDGGGGTADVNNLLIDEWRDGDVVDLANRAVRLIRKRYWKTTYTQKVLDSNSGQVHDVPKEMKDAEVSRIIANQPGLSVFRKPNKVRWMASMAQDIMLEDKKSPIQLGVPECTPMWCYKLNREFFGLIENWKDYQREINKRRSSILKIINNQSSGGWVVDSKTDLSQLKKGHDIVVTKGKPSEHAMQKTQQQIPSALVQYEQYIANDLKQQGVTQSSLGESSANEPAKLFNAKLQQAQVRQSTPTDNLRLATKLHQQKTIMAAQQIYNRPRVLRFIGDDQKEVFFAINTEDWNDVRKAKFDIFLDEGQLSVSSREYGVFLMMNIFEMMANGGYPTEGIPWDILIKNVDIPKRDQIAQRVQTFMSSQGLGAGAPGSPQVAGPGGGAGMNNQISPQQVSAPGMAEAGAL